jgi:hypothetical protein
MSTNLRFVFSSIRLLPRVTVKADGVTIAMISLRSLICLLLPLSVFGGECVHGKGSSINDVTVVGRGGLGFCDNRCKVMVIKSVTMGRGDKKMSKIA